MKVAGYFRCLWSSRCCFAAVVNLIQPVVLVTAIPSSEFVGTKVDADRERYFKCLYSCPLSVLKAAPCRSRFVVSLVLS